MRSTGQTAEWQEPPLGRGGSWNGDAGGMAEPARGRTVPRGSESGACPPDPCTVCADPAELGPSSCLTTCCDGPPTGDAGDLVAVARGRIEPRVHVPDACPPGPCAEHPGPTELSSNPCLRNEAVTASAYLVSQLRYASREADTLAVRSDVAIPTHKDGVSGNKGCNDREREPAAQCSGLREIVGVPQACAPLGQQCMEASGYFEGSDGLLDFKGGGSETDAGEDQEADLCDEGVERQPGAGVWSSSSSGPPRPRNEAPDEVDFKISVSSWNLAGVSKKKIVGIARHSCCSGISKDVGWVALDFT